MIENMSLYTHGLDIELGFRHVWIGPSCPNNNNIFYYFIFESVSLYTAIISETMCLFSNVYMHSPSFMKKNFWEALLERKYFCAFIWVKERERDIEYFTEHGSCVLLLYAVDHFILGGKRLWVSKYHRLCEWRNLL